MTVQGQKVPNEKTKVPIKRVGRVEGINRLNARLGGTYRTCTRKYEGVKGTNARFAGTWTSRVPKERAKSNYMV